MCIREVCGKLSCWYFRFGSFLCLRLLFLSFYGKWCCSCLDIINLLLFSHSVSFPHSWHTEEGTWVDFLHPHVKRRFLDPDTLRDFLFLGFSSLFGPGKEVSGFIIMVGLLVYCAWLCVPCFDSFASFFSFTLLLMNCFNVFLYFLFFLVSLSRGFGTGRQEKRC